MSEQRTEYNAGQMTGSAGQMPAELPPDQAGPIGYTMHFTHLELISLNRALNNRLAALSRSRAEHNPAPGSELAETLDRAEAITAGVLRRVDKLLGVI